MFFSFLTSWVSTTALKLNFLILSRLKNLSDFLIFYVFFLFCFRSGHDLLALSPTFCCQTLVKSECVRFRSLDLTKGVIINTNGARLSCIASTL